MKGEGGFTLAETVTALMVFGILVSVGLPILSEMKIQYRVNMQRMEATVLLKSEMERIQSSSVPVPSQGMKKSEQDGTVYKIRWKKKRVHSHLAGTYVEVLWNDAQKRKQKRSLKGLVYWK
ncbi:type II secretion system protein [Melghirimyces algeriensis]|uniref:Prepilin-type N-terminal cleavage/methylation domain-containing protein n=1 Tax=Melghirimyces algeriensis TaxID=910412 RepID=A0A521BQB6_9BACL|nr:type II secretion system protein [Melghirimyces algeriensis]SMO49336.1 hypothetical protein SAMN06264849_102307 [Melghirimyces algeriensis]